MSSLPLQILLVEDDEACALLAVTVLRNAGHVVQHAATGAEAIAWFRGSKFDLVITDYHLPDTNGLELADQIRAEEQQAGRPSTPIIGLSGCASLEERRRGTQGGMDAVLAKPFRAPDFLAFVARFGAGLA